MFQYAFVYAQSQNLNTSFKLDISSYNSYDLRKYALNQYNIKNVIASTKEINQLKYKHENILERAIRKFHNSPKSFTQSYYKEPHFQFDKNVFKLKGNVYFDGYWQSAYYFDNYRNELLKQFTLRRSPYHKTKQYQQKMLFCESVSLHIRRGDYVTNNKTNSVHGTCDLSYYHEAISYTSSKTENTHFFIFSDDLLWAKVNLIINVPVTFVEINYDNADCDEIFLMSQCKHNIIANSSFSWWGAWLNQNQNKIVIAPQHWFRDTSKKTDDLIPESWIRI